MRSLHHALILVLALCLLAFAMNAQSVKDDQNLFMPGSQQGDASLESSNRCENCHAGYNQAVEPGHNWRGSMMAQAARDPLWIATLAVALQDSQYALGNFNAGDLCIRCHSPMGWLGGHSEPTNTTALAGSDFEGVACDFCHKMVDPIAARMQGDVSGESTSLGVTEAAKTYQMDIAMLSPLSLFDGTPFFSPSNDLPTYYGDGNLPNYVESASGQFFVDTSTPKRGPRYDANPKHQWVYSRYHKSKYFCATCHDVSNPVVGRLQGEDPERQAAGTYGHVERTFSEFMLSAYGRTQGGAPAAAKIGVGVAAKCQDCHMRNVTGPACNKRGIAVRDDLALHDITGGNAWMSGILASADQSGPAFDPYNYAILSGAKYPGASVDVSGLQGFGQALVDGQARALQQLEMAADISTVSDLTDSLTLRITNNSGHKLISGYPEGRRMFLNVAFFDANGVISEINQYDPLVTTTDGAGNESYVSGGVLGHRNEMLVWESHMSSELTGESETQHFVLATGRDKDNRIPPKGFAIDLAGDRMVVPVWNGVEDSSYFTSAEYAGGYDEVTVPKPVGATGWSATLYYQTTSKEYVEFLRNEINGTGTITLGAGNYIAQTDPFFGNLNGWGNAMWDLWLHNGGSAPVAMASLYGGTSPPGPHCDPLAAPGNLTAAGTKRSVTLGWSAVTDADSYNVYLSQGGKYALVGSTAGTSFVHNNLKVGETFCYVVTSVQDCGENGTSESDYSNEACAVPQRK